MWALKILNGAQQGKVVPLNEGHNIVGRSKRADVRVDDNGVSKSHAKFFVTEDKVILSDLNSSNGTYVNGVRVQNHGLQSGDKILVNTTVLSIIQLPDNVLFADLNKPKQLSSSKKALQTQQAAHPPVSAEGALQGANALDIHQPQPTGYMESSSAAYDMAQPQQSTPIQEEEVFQENQWFAKLEEYLDDVALTLLYKSVEKISFTAVFFALPLIYVVCVVLISFLPVRFLLEENIIIENQRRALTLARSLALQNNKGVASGTEISLRTDLIAREDNVEKAYIISADTGKAMAPVEVIGETVSDPFVLSLKNTSKEMVARYSDEFIGASVPIKSYDPRIGDNRTLAYAVVLFKIDSIAIDFQRVLSLFVLLITVVVLLSSLFIFIHYKLALHPIASLNKSVDHSLKEDGMNVTSEIKLPILQRLIDNVNMALSRMTQDVESAGFNSVDKNVDAAELVQMNPVPCFAIDQETETFLAMNDACIGHPLLDGGVGVGSGVTELTDTSFSQSVSDLIQTAQSSPSVRHTNSIPLDHQSFEISIKAIVSGQSISYYLLSVMEELSEGEEL